MRIVPERKIRMEKSPVASIRRQVEIPTSHGPVTLITFYGLIDPREHIALAFGAWKSQAAPLVRVHSECLTGDVFGSGKCDCGEQLREAESRMSREGGIILYLRQEGRGIGFHNKIRAYALQDEGMDTVEANVALGFPPDLRDYGVGAQILKDLGIKEIRMMTNNPKKVISLEGHGLKVVQTVPIIVPPNPHNRHYLETKQNKMGHLLDLQKVSDKSDSCNNQ
jgi:3,4-dihydroxy 2-butanone 4-phosphate synthase / GTP cyclohydrolase II